MPHDIVWRMSPSTTLPSHPRRLWFLLIGLVCFLNTLPVCEPNDTGLLARVLICAQLLIVSILANLSALTSSYPSWRTGGMLANGATGRYVLVRL